MRTVKPYHKFMLKSECPLPPKSSSHIAWRLRLNQCLSYCTWIYSRDSILRFFRFDKALPNDLYTGRRAMPFQDTSFPGTSIGAMEANVVQQLTAHLRQATAAQHWLLWPQCSSLFISLLFSFFFFEFFLLLSYVLLSFFLSFFYVTLFFFLSYFSF